MALLTQRRQQEGMSINLLPQDVKSGQQQKRIFQYVVAAAIAIVLILVVVAVRQRMQISHQENVLADEKAKAATLRAQVDALREYEVLKAEIDSAKLTLRTALTGDINWTKFLDDLDSNMPSDSSLASLSVTSGPGTTALGEPSFGTAQYTGSVTTMPGLAHWLDTMAEITGLRFVYLSNGNKGDDGVTFSASAHLTEGMLSGRCQLEGARCP